MNVSHQVGHLHCYSPELLQVENWAAEVSGTLVVVAGH